MKKISKRDVLFFLAGIFTFFLVDVATNWEQAKAAFWEGYNSTYVNKNLK